MIHLTFLGTSSGIPTSKRNVSSVVIRRENEKKIALIDCGEGTQRQILATPYSLAKIEQIFITHLHGDHVFGLPGLLSTRSLLGSLEPLTLIGPKGLQAFVDQALRGSQSYPKYPLIFHEITEESSFSLWDFVVKPVMMTHNALSYSYVFYEKKPRQTFLWEKVEAFGVPKGPLYKLLKNGETVVLEDGRILDGHDFLGETAPVLKFIVGGDNKEPERLKDHVKDLLLLVHEATFLEDDLGEQWHTTVLRLAQFSERFQIPYVAFTHLSPRYEDYESMRRYRAEISTSYKGTYFVAEDFMTLTLANGTVTREDL